MARSILINCFFILYSLTVSGQQITGHPFDTTGLQSISIDQMGQLYYVYEDGRLHTFNQNKLWTYYNDFGSITEIDVSNPQKLLLFYKELQRVIILDNRLAEIQEMDLELVTSGIITLVKMSRRNDLWIYDEIRRELSHVNQQGEVLSISEPIYYYNEHFIPDQMQIIDNFILLMSEENEVMVYDNFGQFVNIFSVKCNGSLQITNTRAYCLEKGILYWERLQADNEITLDNEHKYLISINNIRSFDVNNLRLVVQKNDGAIQLVPLEN